jgi:hypothetical protein
MSDNQRRRGQSSWHLSGRASALVRAPSEPDDGVGPYSRKELLRMDSDFVSAMEAAIERGLERSPRQDDRAA